MVLPYEVRFDTPAERFIDKAEKHISKRILDRIAELQQNPFPKEAIKIKGRKEDVFRVRVGKYRILYVTFKEQNLIVIIEIDKRGRVYE